MRRWKADYRRQKTASMPNAEEEEEEDEEQSREKGEEEARGGNTER